jgi:hypothetical protein
MDLGEGAIGGGETLGVRIADAGHGIPVVARRARERERRADRDDVEPALVIELIGQGKEVALGGPATVMEDEQS